MPTRHYEYSCGHVRAIKGIPCRTLRVGREASLPNSLFCFQQPQHHTAFGGNHGNHSDCHCDNSPAAALESLNRETHARLAGLPTVRRQSPQRLNTRIYSPFTTDSRRVSVQYGSTRRVSLAYNDVERHHTLFHRDYPCKRCRQSAIAQMYDMVDRQRSQVEMQRVIDGLRPPPHEGRRGKSGNRYRGDSWWDGYEVGMDRGRTLRVRFEGGS